MTDNTDFIKTIIFIVVTTIGAILVALALQWVLPPRYVVMCECSAGKDTLMPRGKA